jgi:tRNA (guanine26-N2/guanine27-N2)-dimethyltransferase
MHLHASSQDGWQREGAAYFRVGPSFFRASSQTGRDLAVLAVIAHKTHPQNKSGSLRILDAMTGCGVRPLRYVLEAGADYVWANEGNVDLQAQLSANLSHSLPPEKYRITHQDANCVFFDCHQRQDFYDLIDVDGFGSPMPTLATALWAVKLGGLLYLTSTDGRATSGHAPKKSLQTYGAYARSHPAIHEQGLRLLMGVAMQQAAARGLAAQPVFAYYQGEVNRVMVRITRRPSAWPADDYGFLAYCHRCGQFQRVPWKKLNRVMCPCCPLSPKSGPIVSGPMWLGPLHNEQDLEAMQQIAMARSTQRIAHPAQSHPDNPELDRWRRCQSLLEMMQAESALPPYFYPLSEIGRRGKIDIPPKQTLIRQLQQQGFAATSTHISAQAIKTDAPLSHCIQMAKQVSQPPLLPE